MASNRVNFIDEDNARRVLLALLKEIAHAARANADEHLYEVGTRDREERNICLARNRAGQQSLTRSRRPNQQNPFRNSAAKFLELLRLAQEFDNFSKFFLSLFH